MQRMRVLLISLSLIISANSCEKIIKDDNLSLARINYSGNELRISGYYYIITENEDLTYSPKYIFYNNGVALSAGLPANNLSKMDENMLNASNNNYKNHKGVWGIFKIDKLNIWIERWHCAEFCKAYTWEGSIINDTTFHIIKSYRMQNGEKTEIKERDEIYHFRQFSPKPDSTNNFIK